MAWPIHSSVKLILGIFGNISALGLFASPVPTIVRIARRKSTEDFAGLPYLCTLLNCSLWSIYGLSPYSDQILVTTINVAGALAAAVYVAVFCSFARPLHRVKLLAILSTIVSLFVALVVVSLTAIHDKDLRSQVVGIIADVVTITMYASPLSIIWLVIKSRSVEFMPFYLSLNVFINALTWTVYSVYVRDVYVGIPNGLGTVLGALQLIIYGLYWRPADRVGAADSSETTKSAEEEEEETKGGVSAC